MLFSLIGSGDAVLVVEFDGEQMDRFEFCPRILWCGGYMVDVLVSY